MIKYISILPIALYLIYIIFKYGVQKSISESYYRLTNKEKPLFFFALVLTSLNFIIGYAIEKQDNTLQTILIFFAGACICFTGAAAEFKGTKLTSTVHVFGASVGYGIGYLFIVFEHGMDAVYFIIPSLLVIWCLKRFFERNKIKISNRYSNENVKIANIVKQKDHFIWWAEVVGLITIYLATIL